MHFSPLHTTKYLLKWQLVLNCTELFSLNIITQQEGKSIINLSVELHFNLVDLILQYNVVTV